MVWFTSLVEDGDVCALVISIAVLFVICRFFVAYDPRLENLGIKVASAVGVIYALASVSSQGINTAADLARIAMRSLAAGALVLGPAWVVLSVGAFIYRHYQRMASAVESRLAARKRVSERRRQDAEEQERQRQRDLEWECTRPEREQAAREAAEIARIAAEQQRQQAQIAAEQRQQEAQRQADEQRQRENVRYQCRLLYDRYAKELKTSMSQKRFDEYFVTYLPDRYSAEEVERRGAELQAMLRDTVKPEPPSRPRRGLHEIQEEFTRRRSEVTASSLDEDTKAALVVDLNREEDKAIRGAMQQ